MNKKAIVVVTGVKFAKALRRFDDKQDVRYYDFTDGTYKMNSGAGAAYMLRDEYELIVQGNSEDAGRRLVELGVVAPEYYFAEPLTNKAAAHRFAQMVAERKAALNLPVHVVHYGAASEASAKLPDGSLGASIWDVPSAAVHDLIDANCVTMINLLQALKEQDVFDGQDVTKVVGLTAIAAIRARAKFSLDNIQKAAGHALLRTLALELTPERIFLTEVLVGSLDGGYYDNDVTLRTSIESSSKIGYGYQPESKPVFTAEQVGDAVRYALNARSNVREIIISPYGQYPHLGA